MNRRLFCEMNPTTYKIAVAKEIGLRHVKNVLSHQKWARQYEMTPLSVRVYCHQSVIRRKLGDVNMKLQDNKAINLSLAVSNINGILIAPGECFSFWQLVGRCTRQKGYRQGLMIKKGKIDSGVGGGMCQLTNLIHWMVLHSPLEIIEHHHHNGFDLFPDDGRVIPFGTGTSITYNYLDYQFMNPTQLTFQLLISVKEDNLWGELRSNKPLTYDYHIEERDSYFTKDNDIYYRHNAIFKLVYNKMTGIKESESLLLTNHAKVMYDEEWIPYMKIR